MVLTHFGLPVPDSLAEPFNLETTEASSPISFTVDLTSSSSCCHTAAGMVASSHLCVHSSSSTSASASVTTAVSSAQPFLQVTNVPLPASVQTANPLPSQHYMALPATFLQPDGVAPPTGLPPPPPPPISAPQSPPAALALTTTAPGSAAAAASVVAPTTADAPAAAAQPVPLASNQDPKTGPALNPSSATISVAPTQNLLQPGLVMSDQNLQWILSSAASSQQNQEQSVRSCFLRGDSQQRDVIVILQYHMYCILVDVDVHGFSLCLCCNCVILTVHQWRCWCAKQMNLYISVFFFLQVKSSIISSAVTLLFAVCSQSQRGAPKVEKVFFTTAIPVGGSTGRSFFIIICSKKILVIYLRDYSQH